MTEVHLVDVSLRDGNQSLWGATGVNTRMTRGVAPLLDRVGYHCVELASSTMLAVAVRYHREDPWERLRAASSQMPNTTLGFLTTGKRFITFYRTPEVLFELAYTLLARNGITRLWVIDPMHDMVGAARTAAMAKRCGFTEVIGGICYTTSPVHTDEYFADSIAELDASGQFDGLYLKDPAGLLTPERLESLYPALTARLTNLPLRELHSHATTGVSPLTLLTAADLGMDILHTALPPLANGSSHPAGPTVVNNLRARGHQVDVDTDAMAAASAYLQRQAKLRRLPAGQPREYDEAYYRHTIPGGVQSTTARQLKEMGRPELFDQVIEESVAVREDLGWPIVMTPFAQYIVAQATLNVVTGQRYKHVSDEVLDMVRGEFGEPPGPIAPELLERAATTPKHAAADGGMSEVTTIDELRTKLGRHLSDEDLMMRAVMPAEQVDAMVAARSATARGDLAGLVKALENRDQPTSFHVRRPGMEIRLDVPARDPEVTP